VSESSAACEARELLASGDAFRTSIGDCVSVEVGRVRAETDRLTSDSEIYAAGFLSCRSAHLASSDHSTAACSNAALADGLVACAARSRVSRASR